MMEGEANQGWETMGVAAIRDSVMTETAVY